MTRPRFPVSLVALTDFFGNLEREGAAFRHRKSSVTACRIAMQVADALTAAACGLVQRDTKRANLMLMGVSHETR